MTDVNTQYAIRNAENASGQLLHNIVLFGRLLRGLGLDVTPTQILDLVAAFDLIDMGHKADVQESARAVLVNRRDDLALFDEAFELFWQVQKKKLPRIELGMLLQRKPQVEEQYRLYGKNAESGQIRERDEPHIEKVQTYSDVETLHQKDFARMTEFELAEVKQFMQTLRWDLQRRRTRRRQPARPGAINWICAAPFARIYAMAANCCAWPTASANSSVGLWCCSVIVVARWSAIHGCCCNFSTPLPTIKITWKPLSLAHA